ncbi:MAG: S8 family serine peptidase [Planctomycetota bacterium]
MSERLPFSAEAFDLVGLTALRNDPAFAGIDGSGTADGDQRQIVVVIDSTVDSSHPLLSNVVDRIDFTDTTVDPDEDPNVLADEHGTHVAGIVGATNPDIGVAPGVQIIGMNVFAGDDAALFDIIAALESTVEIAQTSNVVAVNMSLGSPGRLFENPLPSSADPIIARFNRVVSELERLGVTVVSAAGNDFPGLNDYHFRQNAEFPGINSTIVVGSVWDDTEGSYLNYSPAIPTPEGLSVLEFGTESSLPGAISSFSQRPPSQLPNTLFAPGQSIESTVVVGQAPESNDILAFPGTSMASPLVAGAVAILQDVADTYGGYRLPPDVIRDILVGTAVPIVDGDDEDDFALRIDLNLAGELIGLEEVDFAHTGDQFPLIDIYAAAQAVRALFTETVQDPSEPEELFDPNGTLEFASSLVLPLVDTAIGTTTTAGICNRPNPPSWCTPPDRSRVTGEFGRDGDGLVGEIDVDIYRFVVDTPVEAAFGYEGNGNGVLRLLDADGTQIGEKGESISADLNTGIYYLGVSSDANDGYDPSTLENRVDGSINGVYEITVAATATDINGTLRSATPVSLTGPDTVEIDGGQQTVVSGSLGNDGGEQVVQVRQDVDMYRFTAPADGVVAVDVDVDALLRTRFTRGSSGTGPFVFNSSETRVAFDDHLVVYQVTGETTRFGFTPHSVVGIADDAPGESLYGEPVECDNGNGLTGYLDGEACVFDGEVRVVSQSTRTRITEKEFEGSSTDSYLRFDVERGQEYVIALTSNNNAELNPNELEQRADNTVGFSSQYELTIQYTTFDQDGSLVGSADRFSNADVPPLALNGFGTGVVVLGEDSRADESEVVVTGDDDVDLVTFRPTNNGVLRFTAGTSLDGQDLVLSGFEEDGTLIGRVQGSEILFEVNANEQYFVGISGIANDSYEISRYATTAPSTRANAETPATVNFTYRLRDLDDSLSIRDDTNESANSLQGSQAFYFSGELGRDDSLLVAKASEDVDMFRFQAESNTTYRVRQQTPQQRGLTQKAEMQVSDSSGNVISFRDDGGVAFNAVKGQNYFISVASDSSDSVLEFAATVVPDLGVSDVSPSGNSLVITLNQPISLDGLAVTSTGLDGGFISVSRNGQNVPGSVVQEGNGSLLRFIPATGALEPGDHRVQINTEDMNGLLSRQSGARSSEPVDSTFTALESTAPRLLMGNLVQGPGQTAFGRLEDSRGVPISLVGLDPNVTNSVTFTLEFNDQMLSVDDVQAASGFRIVNTFASAGGQVDVEIARDTGDNFESTAQGTAVAFVRTTVPQDIEYGRKQTLGLVNTAINETASSDAFSLHLVAFRGDSSGDGRFLINDATLIRRQILELDTVNPRFPLVDPSVLMDTSMDAQLLINDATLIRRDILGIDQTLLPSVPAVNIESIDGLDPRVFVPQDIEVPAVQGTSFVVPVQMLVTESDGITFGVQQIAVEYDSELIEYVGIDTSQEPVLGTQLLAVTEPIAGRLRIVNESPAGVELNFNDEVLLASLQFRVVADTPPTETAINLTSEISLFAGDSLTPLVLVPEPTNADNDVVDGLVTFLAPNELSVSSILRENPVDPNTSNDLLTFEVTFNEGVQNFDDSDILVQGTTANATVASISSAIYQVTLQGGDLSDLNGVVSIAIRTENDILSLDGVPLDSPTPDVSETYTISNAVVVSPKLSLSTTDTRKDEGDTGSTDFIFTIARTENLEGTLSVDVDVLGTGSDPANATDFVGGVFPTERLTFGDGEASKTVTVQVQGDMTVENDESFTVRLSNATDSAEIIVDSTTSIIANDDQEQTDPAVFSISSEAAEKNEGNSASTDFVFPVTRTGDPTLAAIIGFQISGDVEASDIQGGVLSGTLNFAAGSSTANLIVNVIGDSVNEQDETLTVTLVSPPEGATIGSASASSTVLNDDIELPDPIIFDISAQDQQKLEGNSGTTPFVFKVSRTGDTTSGAAIEYRVSGDVDASDLLDGTTAGTVNFNAAESNATITVDVLGDLLFEADETLTVSLLNQPAGSSINEGSASSIVRNDDSRPVASYSIAAMAGADRDEGDSGLTIFSFEVTRVGDTTGESSVEFQVVGSGDNASDADDFGGTFPSGTVSFAVGETSKILSISVSADDQIEADEQFTVKLENASGDGVITQESAAGVIRDDDAAGSETRILSPASFSSLVAIPGDSIPTAYIFQAVADTSISVVPVGVGVVGEVIQIVDQSLQQISANVEGTATANLQAGTLNAIIFLPQTQDRIYSIQSSNGFESLANSITTNLFEPTDTNGDGSTSALDALVVINSLSRTEQAGEGAFDASEDWGMYDVNADGRVSAVDALRVINHLNRQDSTHGGQRQSIEAAGESPLAPAASLRSSERAHDAEPHRDPVPTSALETATLGSADDSRAKFANSDLGVESDLKVGSEQVGQWDARAVDDAVVLLSEELLSI